MSLIEYYTPFEKVSKVLSFPIDEPEMTEYELAFLCGLIREKMPRKIVEVGVAAGGTTAVLLECLFSLGLNEQTELFSLDIAESFYRGNGKNTGYLAEEYKRASNWQGKHKIILGHYLPEVVGEIGDNIDFVILDTSHVLPGEMMDFLAIYPYLSPKACVVLHDIALNHYDIYSESFATQLLMDVVVADRIIGEDKNREFGYPNIGAFIVNGDTGRYISNAFNALLITWNNLPKREEFDLYLRLFEESYSTELVKTAKIAYELQLSTKKREWKDEKTKQESWRLSNSYKIGRMITFLPRKIRGLLCLRQ